MNEYLLILILIFFILLYFSNSFLKQTYTNPEIEITPYTNNIKNRILFVLWTGGTLSNNRIRCIKGIKEKTKCNVIIIDKSNINNYILKDYPLHKGYKYLSAIHKADYLRCYLMHHYGGGYTDIKEAKNSWLESYEKIEKNENIWALGLKGPNGGIAFPDEYNKNQRNDLDKFHDRLIAIQYIIYKPRTKLTHDWYNLLNKRMDFYYEKLKENPAKYPRESASGTPKPVWEGGKLNTKYPISWNRILGQINYPLQEKYIQHIKSGLPEPKYNNYI